MEGPGRDEEDVVSPDHAVLRRHSAALHQRQEISLHPFPGHVDGGGFGTPRHFVYLVDEYDAVLLDIATGRGLYLLLVDHLAGLLVAEQRERRLDRHLPGTGVGARHVLEHALQL